MSAIKARNPDATLGGFAIKDLRPGLFHRSELALRIELEAADCGVNSLIPYFIHSLDRARAVFAAVFTGGPATVIIGHEDYTKAGAGDRSLYQRLRAGGLDPEIFRLVERERSKGEDGSVVVRRWFRADDVVDGDCLKLIWLAIAKDLAIRPNIRAFDCYLVHPQMQIVVHFYDDRGADIVGLSPDPIQTLYHRFNHWLLPHDRGRMETAFGNRHAPPPI